MIKLAVYFDNHDTLGHSVRMFSLIRLLKNFWKDKISILVIESGVHKSGLFPFGNYSRNYFIQRYVNRTSEGVLLNSGVIAALKKILHVFKPNIFITERYPFVNDINYAYFPFLLEFLKTKFNTKIISSCAYLTWSTNINQVISKFYDSIVFHFPEDLSFGYRKYLPLNGVKTLDETMERFKNKIIFTGFILTNDRDERKKKIIFPRKKQKLILVSRGGRQENEKMFISSFLVAQRNPKWYFYVSTGPGMTRRRFDELNVYSKEIPNVKLSRVIYPDFDKYLKLSDLAINMAGYNTMVRLLYYRKKSLLLPSNNSEQIWNAEILSSFNVCDVIKGCKISSYIMEEKIKKILEVDSQLSCEIEKSWFCGLENSLKAVKQVIY